MPPETGIPGTLIDELPDGVLLISVENLTILDVNQAFCRMSGWPRDRLLGRAAAEFVHPDDMAARPFGSQRTMPGRITFSERRYRRFDGSYV